jgi:hypothetical protein
MVTAKTPYFNVGTHTGYFPLLAATRMLFFQLDNLANLESVIHDPYLLNAP